MFAAIVSKRHRQTTKMNTFVILSAILACVVADVSHLDSQAPILKANFDSSPSGEFEYGFESGNGIAVQVRGVPTKPAGSEYPALEFQGGYRYASPDGTPVEITYVANENGFQPSGLAIPTPPPTPEYISRSLAFIAAHPPSEYVKNAIVKPASSAYASIIG